MNSRDLLGRIFEAAKEDGYRIEVGRSGLRQIDFGHKKLHEDHLRKLLPEVFKDHAHIPALIDAVAPGRPCAHRPMKGIVARIKSSMSVQ